MKLLDVNTHPSTILGRVCDRCGYRVEMGGTAGRQLPASDDLPSDVQQGAWMARYIAIDIDHAQKLSRCDLCPRCANEYYESIRQFLPHLRRIAHRRGGDGPWIYDYHAIDAATGGIFSVSSLFDEGA